ncbi:MAG: hypothetical protein ACQEWG_07025 [Bacteroidota bacterium]
MIKNSVVVVWWFLTFKIDQNILVALVLYQNTANLMSIFSLADLNLNVPFNNWNSINIDTYNDHNSEFLLIKVAFKKVQMSVGYFVPGLFNWRLA